MSRKFSTARGGERELAELFKSNRIIVRQAVIRLAEDGLAVIERNRGAFVAKPSLNEAIEIYDALTLLEQGVALQLSERMSASRWGELRQHIERQRFAVESNSLELADQLAENFHSLFIQLSQNRIIQAMHAQLVRRTALLRSLFGAEFDYCCLLDEHEKIVELLEKGRIKQAQNLIDAHYRNVVRGYDFENTPSAKVSVSEALAPYLDD